MGEKLEIVTPTESEIPRINNEVGFWRLVRAL